MVESELARDALQGATIKRLMTVPGIDMMVAIDLAAAIGPITRFKGPNQLVSYIGLNPRVHQPGGTGVGGWEETGPGAIGRCRGH